MISKHSARAVTSDPVIELDLTSAQITLDDGWAPFAQATIVGPASSAALLQALDPRESRRVMVTIKQEFGRADTLADMSRRFSTLADISAHFDGLTLAAITNENYHDYTNPGVPYRDPFERQLDLSLRERTIDHAAGTVTMKLASDEARLQDDAHVGVLPLPTNTSSLLALFRGTLFRIGALLLDENADATAHAATIDPAKTEWPPGVTIWAYLSQIAQAANLRLWCDELAVWHLAVDQPTVGETVALTASSSIVNATDTISRDSEWYNAVIVKYSWTDASGIAQVAYDFQRAPGAGGAGNDRVLNVEYTVPYPGPGAAARIYRSVAARGRVVPLTAVNDYDIEPGRPITIALPSTPQQTGVVSAVTWQFPADEMTVKTRELVDTPTDEETP